MQREVLEANPDEQMAVHVVWFEVLGGDRRSEVPIETITDARATHYWDADGDLAEFLSDHAEEIGLQSNGLPWDAYLLFGPESDWGEVPAPLVGSAAPVVNAIDQLKTELTALWK